MDVFIFILNVLILCGVCLILLFGKNYFPAYITEKGKNLATKEDVAEITGEVEKVRTGYAVNLGKINREHQLHAEKVAKIETLYTDEISLLEKCVRYTENGSDFNELIEELARCNARMRLLSTKAIIEQSEIVSNILYKWSSEYRTGMPKKVGNTNIAIISNTDSNHQYKAKELFPMVSYEINKLTMMMKDHLQLIEDDYRMSIQSSL